MICTRNLISFYFYYAMWAARGYKVAWAERNGVYYVFKESAAKRLLNR